MGTGKSTALKPVADIVREQGRTVLDLNRDTRL